MKKTIVYRYLALLFFIITSGITLIISTSLVNLIISFLILTFGAFIIVKFNISHPYVWYTAFFTMYTLGYPLLVLMNENNSNYNYGISKELFYLHWLALVSFLLVVTPKVVDIKKIRNKLSDNTFAFSEYVYWLFTILSFIFLILIKTQGYTSKIQLAESDSLIVILGMRMLLVYILVVAVQLTKDIIGNKKSIYVHFFTTFVITFVVMYFTAERDVLLRYILVVFFIYYALLYKNTHRFKLIITILTLFISIPLSRSIKFLGMRGETSTFESNILVEFINSEFHTQARNVQLLLNQKNVEGIFEGKSFILAINKLMGLSDFSALNWFQNTFYATNRTGMGFSLLGEGYINLGYIGVIMMFMLIGLIIRLSYLSSIKSMYGFVIYLMLIPIAIYTIRADLHNFLSQFLKQVLIMVLIFRVVDTSLSKRTKKKRMGKSEI
ncbi:hypothetical protein CSV69_10080 [Sporosarcina sp. P26b]|uniref:O-antigen polymerase n=1 Tax=Sporosarcina sp. P26b TaxID=2048253 RepID=UPI000C16C7E0|nr:O-antigen polymerase [Sporosarcina sp. P26b]PIC95679.1 hypothetical protein CSV69_10080 [Sporosarcina sp. P26b]